MGVGGPAAPDRARQAVIAGAVCYLLWGSTPILFMALGRAGAGEWEIVGQRAMWAAPWAALLARVMGQRRDFRGPAARAADFLDRPADWPETRYERKARRQGHEVWYFRYVRV